MMRLLTRFARSSSGATSAEFAMVLPLLLIFLLGIIDVGRLMWTWNRAEKATQMGVRFAAVTDMVPGNLAAYDFALQGGIAGGDPIPTSAFASTTCQNGSCTSWGYNGTAFTNIVTRMQMMMPEIQAPNVRIDYENVGLGYAGDPNGPDVSPLVRVRLANLDFTPLSFALFGASVTLPDFSAALTMEDGVGAVSN